MIGRLLWAAVLAGSMGGTAAAGIEVAVPGQRPAAGSDEDELWYAMDRAEAELRESPLLVRDENLNAYVREVACRVTAGFCADLRVYIIDLPWFNASMAPNGMMTVWTGALLRIQDEAELALVLGHEFAHFRQRHSLQQWRKAKRNSAFMATFGLLTFGGGVGAIGSLAGIAGAASTLQFSRQAERESDRIGFSMAVAEGYDAAAGERLWRRMLAEESARTLSKSMPVFASHPQTRDRLEDVRAAGADSTAGGRRDAEAYRRAVSPFLGAWLEAELSRRLYDTSIQVIADLRALADARHQATYTFALAEAHRRRGRGDDLDQAERLYAQAITLPDPPPAAFREHGMALRRRGEAAAAAAALVRYLDLQQEAEDAAYIRGYLAELEGQ